jgi:cytochrome c-type biogenesis protein CcmH/NrfF
MRRVCALLALCALLAAPPALASELHPTLLELETDLVCVTCHEPLNMSTSPLAQQMKRFIREKIEAGWTRSEIEDYFVKALGPQVLAVPGTHGFDLLAWVIPFAVIGTGLVAVGAGAWVWSRNRDGDGDGGQLGGPGALGLGASLEFRVDQELARFDS